MSLRLTRGINPLPKPSSVSLQPIFFRGFHLPTITLAGSPESTATKPPVSTLSTGIGHTSTGTGVVPPKSTTSSSGGGGGGGGGGGSNAGAIAGGVVGGLAVLGLIAAVVTWFVMKKKRARSAPPSNFNAGYPPPDNYPKYEHPPVSPGAISPISPTQMVYNPSDPSTFPTAVHDPSIGNGTSAYPQTLYDPHAARRGQYSGAPEV